MLQIVKYMSVMIKNFIFAVYYLLVLSLSFIFEFYYPYILLSLSFYIAFYYFLSNVITVVQQKIILKGINQRIDDMTDKAVLKELKNIQEAEKVRKLLRDSIEADVMERKITYFDKV